jgi:hypothetical protein
VNDWAAGAPDIKVQMPSEHTLAAGKVEDDATFTLATGLKEETWIKAVDLLPGERSMVREAIIALENGPVLGAWAPGEPAIAAPNGTAFKLPAGARLTLKVHYKKNWADEQNVKTDRSTIGLYVTEAPLSGRSIEGFSVASGEGNGNGERKFAATLKPAARIVALRPSFDQAYSSVSVDAVAPSGRRVNLLRLRAPQPQWYRRYWLQESVEVPAGGKFEVTAVPAPPDEFGIPAPKRYPLAVDIDYIAQ